MKICFMGTPNFASKALQEILNKGYEVSCVYTRSPKPSGRGYKMLTSAVYDLAQVKKIPIRTPKSFRKFPEEKDEFLSQEFDLVVVASYGLILPEEIIKAPKYGCLNIHGSLLPRWRGASPIQMAIASGDTQTGITIMQMDEGLDTGNILLKESIPITNKTTFASLYEDLSHLGAKLIIEALSKLEHGKLISETQDNLISTYAPILRKKDGLLDFSDTAIQINQKVRGFNPFPSTYFFYKNESIKVLETEVLDNIHFEKTSHSTGEIVSRNNKELVIFCKNSFIKITKLQRSSKKVLPTEEVLNSFNFEIGYIVNS